MYLNLSNNPSIHKWNIWQLSRSLILIYLNISQAFQLNIVPQFNGTHQPSDSVSGWMNWLSILTSIRQSIKPMTIHITNIQLSISLYKQPSPLYPLLFVTKRPGEDACFSFFQPVTDRRYSWYISILIGFWFNVEPSGFRQSGARKQTRMKICGEKRNIEICFSLLCSIFWPEMLARLDSRILQNIDKTHNCW